MLREKSRLKDSCSLSKLSHNSLAGTGKLSNLASLNDPNSNEKFYELDLSAKKKLKRSGENNVKKFERRSPAFDEDDLFSRLNKISQIDDDYKQDIEETVNYDEIDNLRNMIRSEKDQNFKDFEKKSKSSNANNQTGMHTQKSKNSHNPSGNHSKDKIFSKTNSQNISQKELKKPNHDRNFSKDVKNSHFENKSYDYNPITVEDKSGQNKSRNPLAQKNNNNQQIRTRDNSKKPAHQKNNKSGNLDHKSNKEKVDSDYFYKLANEIELSKQSNDTKSFKKSDKENHRAETYYFETENMVTDGDENDKADVTEQFLRSKIAGYKEKKNFVELNRKNITPKKQNPLENNLASEYSTQPVSIMTTKSPLKWEPRVVRKKVEVPEHPFQPMLSKNSMLIAEKLNYDPREKLYEAARYSGKKGKVIEMDYEFEDEECTFQPKINQMSKYIDKKLIKDEEKKTRSEMLYEMQDYYDARRDLLLQKKNFEQDMEINALSFKPKKSNQPTYQPHVQVGSDVATRTQQWQAKKQEKINMEKKKKDQVEASHSYKPVINDYKKEEEKSQDYFSSKFMQQGLMDHFQRIEKAKKEKEDKDMRLNGKKSNNQGSYANGNVTSRTTRNDVTPKKGYSSNKMSKGSVDKFENETIKKLRSD